MTVTGVRHDHLAIAQRYAAEADRWPVTPRFDPLERWYHRLAVTDDYEVWLLTWLPGQGTEIHDHGGSAGAFHVFSGTLNEETVAARNGAPRVITRELGDGAGRRFGEHHVHRMTNRSTQPAISVHVYGPALTTMTKYRLSPAGLEVLTVERAGLEW
ncbi:cysteine dioxygenase [Actinoplanes sp. CA-015351]|uniref:cysteine dioxygenase n=1 Tax=Actinoplanes sp. CA-015351 TaxID=3239897 RepID=UPI003D95A576